MHSTETNIFYSCQLLYDLRDTTAWISRKELNNHFYDLVDDPSPSGFKTQFEWNKLDETIKTLLNKEVFSVVAGEYEWKVIKEHISFIEAFNIRNKFKFDRKNSFVVPDVAAIIIKNQQFYLPNCGNNPKRCLSFENGFMIIGDMSLLMCRWI